MCVSGWARLARGGVAARRARALSSLGASASGGARVKTYELRGHGAGGACSIVAGQHAVRTDLPRAMGGRDEAPQPVELLVSALIGCEQATAAFVARQMKPRMALRGIAFEYTAARDDRGATSLPLHAPPPARAGLGRVWGTARVHLAEGGSETRERIEELKRLVEERCPVANTLASGGCELSIEWVLAEPGAEFPG